MKIFSLVLFGYGIGFEFKKSYKNFNPNKPDCKNDGSITKFKFNAECHKYIDWCFIARLYYNYIFIFRIYLNRE